MPLFNSLVDAVAADEAYLQRVLGAAAQHDAFTARLLALLDSSRAARAAVRSAGREVVLGVHRSDYMLDAPSGKFLQVRASGGVQVGVPGVGVCGVQVRVRAPGVGRTVVTLLRRSAEPAHSTEALKGTSRQGSGPQLGHAP